MKPILKLATAALVAAIALPLTVQAHRQWLFPSATILSGNDPWVTIDAAISNDLFYFEHFPLRLDNLVVTAPDGTSAKAENAATGRYRSTFDVHLTQKGTYKIAVVNNTVAATYQENGQEKTWRGSPDAFTKEVPAGAANLKVSRTSGRVEVFVTSGKPTETVLKPTGVGLELAPVTHPNDLIAGEPATFGFVLDGKPAANLAVTLIPGGIRYRDTLGEIKATTDQDGKVTVTLSAVEPAGRESASVPLTSNRVRTVTRSAVRTRSSPAGITSSSKLSRWGSPGAGGAEPPLPPPQAASSQATVSPRRAELRRRKTGRSRACMVGDRALAWRICSPPCSTSRRAGA